MRENLLKINAIFLLVMVMQAYLVRDDIRGAYLTDASSLEKTSGAIVHSYVSTMEERDPFVGWLTLGQSYTYSIGYEFEVGDRVFHSDSITFASQSSWNDAHPAESYVNRYPEGHTVTVFYDKNDPSFSVLEPNVRNERLIFLIVGIGLSLVIFVAVITIEFMQALAYDRQRSSRFRSGGGNHTEPSEPHKR